MDLVRPRYEFRTFRDDLTRLEEQVSSIGSRLTPRHPAIEEADEIVQDIYFVRGGATGRSLKIRNDRLELKALLSCCDQLELWQPVVSSSFPLSWDHVRDAILPDVELPDSSSRVDCGTFLDLLRGAVPQVLIHHVRKARQRFLIDGILVTLDRMCINGASAQSVTIEADRTKHVNEIRKLLRLSDAENVSVPRMLSRVAGLLPQEVGRSDLAACG